MCTCKREVEMRDLRSAVMMGLFASVKCETRMLSITLARRGMLKWCNGSKRMMAAFWPGRGIEAVEEGRMACAMMRWRREVLPDPEGWWDGGGEMSSRCGGVWNERRESSSGMPEKM